LSITPTEALTRCIEHREIFHDEMLSLWRRLMSGELSPVQIAGLLLGLRVKKETIGEIAAAARIMREFATKVPVADRRRLLGCWRIDFADSSRVLIDIRRLHIDDAVVGTVAVEHTVKLVHALDAVCTCVGSEDRQRGRLCLKGIGIYRRAAGKRHRECNQSQKTGNHSLHRPTPR